MTRPIAQTLLATALSLPLFGTLPAVAAQQEAIFAGGCFWCIEKDFEKYVDGVIDVKSGYIGGTNENPTYENHGKYKHREAVKIVFDDTKTDYATLLNVFFRSVDPTDAGGQFCDRGHSYTTAVYALDDAQRVAAEQAKAEAEQALGKPVVTPIEAASTFTDSEDYHQDYYEKSTLRYTYYRAACGRDKAVKALWGDAAYTGIKDQSS